uniref:Uncharacterized protein n=1 Tax=Anguilla anguilla TaxID=7936 RepID=A0A0E9X7L3_ANGAN
MDRPGPGEREAAGQQAGGRVRAHHGEDQEPEVRHRGRHHHPPHRRPHQALPRPEGRRAVLPGRRPFRIPGGLRAEGASPPRHDGIAVAVSYLYLYTRLTVVVSVSRALGLAHFHSPRQTVASGTVTFVVLFLDV